MIRECFWLIVTTKEWDTHKQDFDIVFQGDAALFNQYGIIAVNPAVFDHVNATGAQTFIDWMLSDRGQELIAAYMVDGEQLFFPNAAQ